MSKAADLANLIGNINAGGSGGANKNFIINGAMNVNQRGTITGVANNDYTLDRFMFTYSQDGAFTVTQDSSSPDGFANSLKLDVTSADSSLASSQYLIMEHKIEGQNLQHLQFGKSGAKNITLSFYVKSNKTGTYGVSIIQSDNSSKIANLTYTINSANTWEQKSLTFTGDTSGLINNDTGIGLKVGFTLAVGSTWTSGDTSASFRTFVNGNYGAGQTVNILDHVDNEWFITGIQLEIGQNATSFEHEPFERTLLKCHRYYRRWGKQSGDKPAIAAGMAYDTTHVYFPLTLDVPMRSQPTVDYSNLPRAYKNNTAARLTTVSINTAESDEHSVRIEGENTNYFTAEAATWLQVHNAGEWFALKAEL